MFQTNNESEVNKVSLNGQNSTPKSESKKGEATHFNLSVARPNEPPIPNVMLICLNEADVKTAKYHGLKATYFEGNTTPTKAQMQELDRAVQHLVLVVAGSEKAKRQAQRQFGKYDLPSFYLSPKKDSKPVEDSKPVMRLADYLTQLGDISLFCDDVKNSIKKWEERKQITVWEHGGKYYKSVTIGRGNNARTFTVEISDFVLRCNGLVIGSKASQLILAATKAGKEQELAIDTDDFIGSGKLKSIMTRQGYIFRPEAADIDSIFYLTTRFSPHYQSIEILGQYEDCFVFENGIIQKGKFLPKNKHNIVGNYHLSIDKDKDRPITYNAASNLDIAGFLSLLVTVYGKEKAYTGFAMIVASVFYDLIVESTPFPILNAYGKPETGKSTFVRLLMGLFTQKRLFKGISLSGDGGTKVGINRTLSKTANIPMWFDEYKNDIDIKMLRMLRNIFDGTGRVTGAYTNDNKTNNYSIMRPIIISGEHIPTKEPALMSRCVMLDFDQIEHDITQQTGMSKIENEMELGLSHITLQLLAYRPIIAAKFSNYFNKRRQEIYRESQTRNGGLSTRTCSLFAVPLAIMELLFEGGLTLGEGINFMSFYTVMFDLAFKQNALKTETTAVNLFWEHFSYMLDNSLLVEKQDYLFSEGEGELWLASGTFTKYIQSYRRVHNENPLDKPTLQGYLKSEDYFTGYSNKTIDTKKQRKVYRFGLDRLRELELILKKE